MNKNDLIIIGIVHDYYSSGFIFYNKNDKNYYIYDYVSFSNRLYDSSLSAECDECSFDEDILDYLTINSPITSSIWWSSYNNVYGFDRYTCKTTYFPLNDTIVTSGEKEGGYYGATTNYYPSEKIYQKCENISNKLRIFNDNTSSSRYKKTIVYLNKFKETLNKAIEQSKVNDINDDFNDDIESFDYDEYFSYEDALFERYLLEEEKKKKNEEK